MTDIKIKINHFGPLNNITLHWAPFMVLTGHSNLGKSYANYLIYYVMSGLLNESFREMLETKMPNSKDYGAFLISISEIEAYLNNNVQDYMRSFLGDDILECDVEIYIKSDVEEFTCRYDKIKIEPTVSDMTFDDIYSISMNDEKLVNFPRFELIIYALNYLIIRSLFGDSEYYIREILLPPGRGAFVGENYTTKESKSSSMNMYNEYFNDYDISQKKEDFVKEENDDIYNVISKLVGGEFVLEKSKQYIILSTGEKISLTAAASSIKEISPLLLYFLNKKRDNRFSYCLEEPEAHLHPCSQIKIADLIACFLNRGNAFQITTHSDYFLQRINQLIKLGDIRKADEEAFEKLCDERGLLKSSYIDRSKVKAYYFHKNAEGKVEVEDMPLTQDGISYKTFYDITRDLNEREEYINEQLYKLNEK